MKKIIALAIILFLQGRLLYAQSISNERFANWSEEQYQKYEDSIRASLYTPVVICKFDTTEITKKESVVIPKQTPLTDNPYVPTYQNIDVTKSVGQITIKSGTSETGARTYDIPIDIPRGMNGHQPNLALSYNSQIGNSIMGIGWSISGLSQISRSRNSMYYDKKVQGITMDNKDAFVLDGIRLINTNTYSEYLLFESEQGNIKAKGYCAGNVLKYFEVFYPDGSKGIYGFTSNAKNLLYYPLTSLVDFKGNTITYSYSNADNHYRITKISYNGASIEFKYITSRQDPLLAYSGGLKVYENTLLSEISTKSGSSLLNAFKLNYTVRNSVSLLTRVDYYSSGSAFNPIRFYYGEGNTANSFEQESIRLSEGYDAENTNMIKTVKGRFDVYSGFDGIVSLPNLNPYWKHYRHHTVFRHSQNRFDNGYQGNERIYIYCGLNNGMSYPASDLLTESGFIDILCADLEGKQQDDIIKINNSVVDDKDKVTFTVYRSNRYMGMTKLLTRSYNFPTVYEDADGGKSIQPKFYYTGDFNGDGKMEVLAISVHQPFEDINKPSKCYIFDLKNNGILYQNHVLPLYIDFVGTQQEDAQAAANNSDKLLAMDYDGDGKTDICHVNATGTHIYTFDINGTVMTARKVATYSGITKAKLVNRQLFVGDFNGDGLMDLLVSPPHTFASNISWTVYYSKGNGSFDPLMALGPNNSNQNNTGFIIQDLNNDGKSDVIKYTGNGFYAYITSRNVFSEQTVYTTFPNANSILIPTNSNSDNIFTQLICLKATNVAKYSFSRNDNKEALVTGVANSLGVIEKNYYQLLTDGAVNHNTGEAVYTEGYDAVYPYVNIKEPLPVLASTETFLDDKLIDYGCFSYENAVLHKQGLGFCGFKKISFTDKRDKRYTRSFNPYNHALLTAENTPTNENTYSYSTQILSNKIAKIRLTKKTEKDKLKNITATSLYEYDGYGYPTAETTTFSDNTTIKRENIYRSYTDLSTDYRLGVLNQQETTTTYNGTVYKEKFFIPIWSQKQPIIKVYYKDGNAVKQLTYAYDGFGNVISEDRIQYSSPALRTQYAYDSNGRVIQETTPMGLSTKYTYNTLGRLSSKIDFRGGTTTYEYDEFGRESKVTYPDNTVRETHYAWSSANNGKYAITISGTTIPLSTSIYDAFNREVRTQVTRFNSEKITTDKIYDQYGNIERVSQPFFGNSASLWNTYMYDIYDRPIAFNEKHGRTVTHSYSGNSTTITEDDVSTTKTYDVLGNMVSATDPAGTIRYKFHPDGQPISIVAPGNVTTSFGYDKYRRRTTLTDPSCGTTLYEYDAAGNVSKETNANNQTIINEYDSYSRLAKRSTPEFTTSYTYNANNELTRISSNNGTSKAFTYDGLGRIKSFRETAVDGKWLQKDYSYSNGNISSIQYNSSYFLSVIEDYYYTNSYLTEVILDKQKSIYKLSEENSQGQSTKIITGNITREYSFDNRGLPTWFNAETARSVIQDFLYDYDAKSGNLFAWRNNRRNTTESFSYDNLNRLIEDSNNSVEYGANGNILSRSDIGTYEYGNSSKPYAVTGINFSKNGMPTGNQDITYTSFSRPKYIMENGYKAEFSYNGNYDRVKMDITHNDSSILTRYYLAGCYELQESPSADIIERLYLGGDYYSASTVYVMEAFYGEPYHIMRDPLGSIMHITDTEGNVVQELSYDAWGRLRNPANHKVYAPGLEPNLFLGRGYTGHEHLPLFGLINMNARLYDPVLGRFLSPDPYIQMPDFTQNFNRYSYCLNNPMRYNDKNGEFILGFISGFFRGLFQGKNPLKTGWQTGVNELKIYGGLFALDSRKNLLAKGWELVSRFTWQLPQTIIGLNYTQISNWAWQVDRVDYWGGATVSSGNNWGKGSGAAVTLGSYITGGSELKADPNNALFQHEYGHYLQSQEMGWAYLPRVGIPSVMSTFKNDRNHKYQPYEQDANRRAFLYFNKNVEGFYKTFDERNEKRGWDFYRNPLDVYHTASNDRYYDYYNPQHLALLNNLSLHAKWFDYTPMIIDIGIGNGIYYNNHRIK